MRFDTGFAMTGYELRVYRDICEDDTLDEEQSKAKFKAMIAGDVKEVKAVEKPTLTRGQKASQTRKNNKAKALAKAEVDAEIAAAEARLKEEEK